MVVYKITNKKNKKVYIGITTRKNGFKGRYPSRGQGIERVYNFHLQCKERGDYYNIHLLRTIEKYGFENFEVNEEFDKAKDIEELKKKEKYWIEYYNSDNPKYGYNNTKGGDGVSNPNILTIIKKRITHAKKYNKRLNNISKKNGWGNLVKNEKEHGLVFLLKRESEYKNTSILHCKMCGIMYTRRNGGKGGFCDYCQKYKKHYKYIKKILK